MKRILYIILGLLLLVTIGGVVFLLVVSPNHFKPQIEELASEQGVALTLDGDLSWTLWPNIGIGMSKVSVAHVSDPTRPLAQLKQASLLLALKPLFDGEFQVNHIVIDGVVLDLRVDAQGVSNWDAFLEDTPVDNLQENQQDTPEESNNEENEKIILEVDRFSVTNSAVHFADEQSQQTFDITGFSFTANDININNEPFDTTIAWKVALSSPELASPLHINGELVQRITVDETFDTLSIDNGVLTIGVGDSVNAKESIPAAITYNMALATLNTSPTYRGDIAIQAVNVRKLLALFDVALDTANTSALSNVAYKSQFDGNASSVNITNVVLTVDKTTFKGRVAIKDIATQELSLQLAGDSLNADEYLPLDEPSSTSVPSPVTAIESPEEPLPLEVMRSLTMDVSVALEKLQIKNLDVENITYALKAAGGDVNQVFAADAYSGKLSAKIDLNAKTSTAKSGLDFQATGIELEPILKALEVESKAELQGAVTIAAKGISSGKFVSELTDNMDSTATFSGAQIRLSPINLERQFCKLVSDLQEGDLLQQASETTTWPKYTEMRELSGSIVWKDQVISISTFKAGVEQFYVGATGQIDLRKDTYDFTLPFQFVDAQASGENPSDASGEVSPYDCSFTSSYWLNRSISLFRCKGVFAALSPIDDCGVDSVAVRELAKDFAEYKLKEKHGDKIDEAKQKVEDKKQELLNDLQDSLGVDEEETKPKDILKGLIKDKLFK